VQTGSRIFPEGHDSSPSEVVLHSKVGTQGIDYVHPGVPLFMLLQKYLHHTLPVFLK
jgi:hypothetical protein